MRFALALLLLLAPLLVVAISAAFDVQAWSSWNEAPRLLSLATNTLGLATIAAVVAVPAGTLAAFVLERVQVPKLTLLRLAVGVALFVPLPVTAVAWQIVLDLPSLALPPGDVSWRPWAQGLLPAGFVHGLAALPWVIAIVSVGLRTSDRVLEEDAIVLGGPRLAIRRVLLPRLMLAGLAAFGWVLVQTSTEIPITDAMMVRTYAEEVYTQIVGFTGVRGAVAVTLPPVALLATLSIIAVRGMIRRFPLNLEPTTTARPLSLPPRTRHCLVLYLAALLIIVDVMPITALLWKAAGGGTLQAPSLSFALDQIAKVIRLSGVVILQSLLAAVVTGYLTASLATTLAWHARDSATKSLLLLMTAILLALMPGPVLGQGLKETIAILLHAEEWLFRTLSLTLPFPPLRSLLYDQPSPVPTIVAAMLRLLPVALLIVSPVLRAIPRDLLDLARLDGVSVWRIVGRPQMTRATTIAAVAVAGLAMSEVSAGKLVAPLGYRMFVLELFEQMHYGSEPTVAALALVQTAATTLLVLAGLLAIRIHSRRERIH